MMKKVDWNEWENMYQCFKDSKLSIKSWCLNNNMDVAQFYYRRKKYNERTCSITDTNQKRGSFVKVDHTNIKSSAMTISFNSGISLSIDGSVDMELIKSLSMVLNNV